MPQHDDRSSQDLADLIEHTAEFEKDYEEGCIVQGGRLGVDPKDRRADVSPSSFPVNQHCGQAI